MALGAAKWEPVQPGAEVVNILRRWQELGRALLGSTEHSRGVGLQQRKVAEEIGRLRTVAGRRDTAGRGGARTAPDPPSIPGSIGSPTCQAGDRTKLWRVIKIKGEGR